MTEYARRASPRALNVLQRVKTNFSCGFFLTCITGLVVYYVDDHIGSSLLPPLKILYFFLPASLWSCGKILNITFSRSNWSSFQSALWPAYTALNNFVDTLWTRRWPRGKDQVCGIVKGRWELRTSRSKVFLKGFLLLLVVFVVSKF